MSNDEKLHPDQAELGSPGRMTDEYGQFRSPFIRAFTGAMRDAREEQISAARDELFQAKEPREKESLERKIAALEGYVRRELEPPNEREDE